MHKRQLKTRAPWILWDCKTLFNDQDKFQEIFLGDHEKEGILKKASGGMLILENIDVVSERNLDWLLAFLRGEKIQGQDEWPWQKDYHCITIFSTMKETNEMMLNLLRGRMDFRIAIVRRTFYRRTILDFAEVLQRRGKSHGPDD